MVLDMAYAYLENCRKEEKNRLIKSLIPSFLLLVRKRSQYKRAFPKSYIDMQSRVSLQADIGEHVVVRKDCEIGEDVAIGRFTTIGPKTIMNGAGKINIGSFGSIAPECLFWSENHKTDQKSTFPFEQFQLGKETSTSIYEGADINIGHDVWIGQRAIILAGANIGHGCVVAAGAVVPKGSYEPYSVIAGVPAKAVKKRFDEKRIQELIEEAWWNKDAKAIFK